MPLYRLTGQPDDNTYLFDDPPDDPRYELVTEPVAPAVFSPPPAEEPPAPEPVADPEVPATPPQEA